jgi:hypothetical protein
LILRLVSGALIQLQWCLNSLKLLTDDYNVVYRYVSETFPEFMDKLKTHGGKLNDSLPDSTSTLIYDV